MWSAESKGYSREKDRKPGSSRDPRETSLVQRNSDWLVKQTKPRDGLSPQSGSANAVTGAVLPGIANARGPHPFRGRKSSIFQGFSKNAQKPAGRGRGGDSSRSSIAPPGGDSQLAPGSWYLCCKAPQQSGQGSQRGSPLSCLLALPFPLRTARRSLDQFWAVWPTHMPCEELSITHNELVLSGFKPLSRSCPFDPLYGHTTDSSINTSISQSGN